MKRCAQSHSAQGLALGTEALLGSPPISALLNVYAFLASQHPHTVLPHGCIFPSSEYYLPKEEAKNSLVSVWPNPGRLGIYFFLLANFLLKN